MNIRSLTVLCALPLALGTTAAAQSLKKERHAAIGLPTLYVPRSFDAIPVQPDEEWVRLYYKEKPHTELGRSATKRKFRPEMRIVLIPRRAAATGPDAKDDDDDAPAITNVITYAEHGMNGWKAELLGPGKRDRNFQNSCYELKGPRLGEKKNRTNPLCGYSYMWETQTAQIGLVGICHFDDYAELRELWEKVGDKMKVAEPEESQWSGAKLDRYYRYKSFSHVDYRIRVREALVEGWEAEDTENYIVVFHTDDQPLLRKVMRDLELLRQEYMKLFPPASDFDAVSTVRICEDRDEYIAYGGAPRSAGYWNSPTEELVLYDAEKQEKGKRPDDSDTFVTLYHEAFHQYIHYSTGELPPHSWFNEGYGDYFSGATIKNGKVRGIGVNPWRVGLIQAVVERGFPSDPVPWKDIIEFTQGQYYTNAGPKYAQGWSMVYFLNTCPEVARRPEWKKILPTYFDTLKTRFGEEVAKLEDPAAPEKRAAAGQLARTDALEAAFANVDLQEIDTAWQEFVLTLEVPGG